MNQPRYNDSGSGGNNSWHNNYPGNRRNVNHSTGRSNYGGNNSRPNSNNNNRGNNNNKQQNQNDRKGNPIGNWIQNRRQRRIQRQRSSNGGAVGTEAKAMQNMATNAKHYNYPPEGFVTPIEHSLLYAMIEFPDCYPEGVVKSVIEDEEFDVYLYVNEDDKNKRKARRNDSDTQEQDNEGGGEDGEGSDPNNTATNNNGIGNGEERVSYAQLSALAALSAEKNPSTATPSLSSRGPPVGQSTNNQSQQHTGELRPPNERGLNKSGNSQQQQIENEQVLTIGQALVRKLLRTITKYSDTHSLDRQNEIREFLTPIERRCQMRNESAALKQLLPAYMGYTVSLLTGNPLPLLIGAAALTGPDPMQDENSNVSGFRAVGGRAGDMETAGLLDECESD